MHKIQTKNRKERDFDAIARRKVSTGRVVEVFDREKVNKSEWRWYVAASNLPAKCQRDKAGPEISTMKFLNEITLWFPA